MPPLIRLPFALVRILLVGAVTTAAVSLLRYQLVEPDAVAQLCLRADAPAWCEGRRWIVLGFAWNAYGWASVVFAVAALFTRSIIPAMAGLVLGLTGALFYRYFPAGLGLLSSALLLARRWTPPAARAAGKQHAQRGP